MESNILVNICVCVDYCIIRGGTASDAAKAGILFVLIL